MLETGESFSDITRLRCRTRIIIRGSLARLILIRSFTKIAISNKIQTTNRMHRSLVSAHGTCGAALSRNCRIRTQ